MLYRIDLPRDDNGLVKGVLEGLAKQFDNDRVKIDTKVFNPSRIVKLYGTVARKGDSISERPHRRTGVLAIPQTMVIVSREQLEAVGGEIAKEKAKVTAPRSTNLLLAGDRTGLLERAKLPAEDTTRHFG